jgi:hypothetical protein
MQKRKARYKEIKVWYKLRPSLSMWTSREKGKSLISKLPEESWYGGYWFNSGYFMFIQFRFFAVHIMFRWWRLRI